MQGVMQARLGRLQCDQNISASWRFNASLGPFQSSLTPFRFRLPILLI